MGWTHDDRDLVGNGGTLSEQVPEQRTGGELPRHPAPGIPRLLRRRARWVGARLRHPRG